MDYEIDKATLLRRMWDERANFETAFMQLTDEQMDRPGSLGAWSVKDIIGHITSWERRLSLWLETAAAGGVPVRPEPGKSWDDLDAINAISLRENEGRPIQHMLADFHQTFERVLTVVKAMPEDDLVRPGRWAWADGRSLVPMIAANTYEHYAEHFEQLHSYVRSVTLCPLPVEPAMAEPSSSATPGDVTGNDH